jgi:hypothetical protein
MTPHDSRRLAVVVVLAHLLIPGALYGQSANDASISPKEELLGGYRLGESVARFPRTVGPLPLQGSAFREFVTQSPGIVLFGSHNHSVAIKAVNGTIAEIMSVSSETSTDQLVRPGMATSAALRAYGRPDSVVKTTCGFRFDYQITKEVLLRFWVCSGLNVDVNVAVGAPLTAISIARPQIDAAEGVADALRRLAQAYKTRDTSNIQLVYPTLPGADTLSAFFQNYKSYSLSLDVKALNVSGDQQLATATVGGTAEILGRSGAPKTSPLPLKVYYFARQRDGTWIIKSES